MTGNSWPPPSRRRTEERRPPHLRRRDLGLGWRLASVIVLTASALMTPSVYASADGTTTPVEVTALDQFINKELTAASSRAPR